MNDPLLDFFRPDPKRDARILNSVEPSDFFPAAGQFFRVRWATVADRSYSGCIWECIGSQSHCAVGRKVLDTYTGLTGARIGEVLSFVAGDVIFYDCSEIWAAIQADRAKPADEPVPEQQS